MVGLALWCLAPATALAQGEGPWRLGVGASLMLNRGDGVARTCAGPLYDLGVVTRLGRHLTRLLSAEVSVRAHAIEKGGNTCIVDHVASDGPSRPVLQLASPPTASPDVGGDAAPYFIDPLLTTRFVATDLRLRAALPVIPVAPTISVGVGNAWRKHPNVPYGFVSGGLLLGGTGRWRATLEGEVQNLRVTGAEYLFTPQDQLVVGPLGTVRQWSRTTTFGLTVGVAF